MACWPVTNSTRKLAKYMVIAEATPYWLAVYAQQGPEKEKVIERLLADKQLMIRMLVADGPVWEKYGPAVEIYQHIQKASPRAKQGLFQRLALAVALEHAVPLRLESREADGEEPQYADPIQRYLSYEKAYLADELDPGFEGLSTWSLRMVVNGTEPDDISAWGRKMLRNYRPDHVTNPDLAWRYVKSVDTEINYTSTYQKLGWDRPDLQRYQNILANGGICGRRAHFGRFILRAFGDSHHGAVAAGPRRPGSLDARRLGALSRRRLGRRQQDHLLSLPDRPRFPRQYAGPGGCASVHEGETGPMDR